MIIKPRRFTQISIQELLEYRELFWALAKRDYKIRYAQTGVGMAWAVIQPLATLLIMHVVFDKFAKVETNGIHHLLFTTSGLFCWTYFSYVITNSGNSIIMAQAMIKKIYFPRLIVPVSKAIVGLIDFAIVLAMLAVLMVIYDQPVSVNVVFFPLFIALNVISALGIGIWISALSVRFRDFQYVVPFLVQIGLYASPVAFPSSLALEHLPNWMNTLYHLNPVVGVIDGFRMSLFGTDSFGSLSLLSIASGLFFFISGVLYFQKVESEIADIV
ncbi:MAG: ABC transporter permease [Salibacteraceae bacterium]